MIASYLGRDYGDYFRQHDDWLERTGLLEPCRDEQWEPPVEPPLVAVPNLTRYPLDVR